MKKLTAITALLLIAAGCASCSQVSGNSPEAPEITTDTTTDAATKVAADATTEAITTSASPLTEYEIRTLISDKLRILVDGAESHSSEQKIIDANPDAFAEIVALGEAALPYLEEYAGYRETYAKLGDSWNLYRCGVAMAAADRIQPGLYDLSFSSPDGRFTLKAGLSSVFSMTVSGLGIQYENIQLDDAQTGELLAEVPFTSAVVYTGSDQVYYNLNAVWSPDSRYVLITEGNRYYGGAGVVFDTVDNRAVTLPRKTVMNAMQAADSSVSLLHGYICCGEWLSQTQLRIHVNTRTGNTPQGSAPQGEASQMEFIQGWYTYDLTQEKASEIAYASEPSPTHGELADIIGEKLELLIQDGGRSEQEMIDAHPDAFAEIVALGENALPCLSKIMEETEGSLTYRDLRLRLAAMAAAYGIQPELYDLNVPSPDGRYTLEAKVSSLCRDSHTLIAEASYTQLNLVDGGTGDVIASLEGKFVEPTVTWSPDGRYAAVLQLPQNQWQLGTVTVMDAAERNFVSMPRVEILNRINADQQGEADLHSCGLLSCQWTSDALLQVNVEIKTGASYYPQSFPGWYTYDLSAGKVAGLDCSIEAEAPSETTLTADEISAVIDKNLDLLLTDSGDFSSEEDFIDAHPEAFAEIVALGEAALPYLDEVMKEHPLPAYVVAQADMRGFAAKMAAYVIEPERYDLICPSPDGKYELRADVNTFYGTVWGGMIVTAYEQARIVDSADGEILTPSGRDTSYSGYYTYAEAAWSPDSRYAALRSSDGKYFTNTEIYDAVGGRYIALPSMAEVLELIESSQPGAAGELDGYDRYDFFVEEWLGGDRVKIGFVLAAGNSYGVTGWYTYDLAGETIADVELG